MNLEQKKKELQKEKNNILDKLKNIDNEIIKYDNLKHITTPQLYNELSYFTDIKTKFKLNIGIKTKQGEYEYILGGDGRSMPWSEKRKGTLCIVETKYYLSRDQIELVKTYFKNIGYIDKIEVLYL